MRRRRVLPLSHYRAAWRRNEKRKAQLYETMRKKAIMEAKRLARIMAENYCVTRVILFGSSIKPEGFNATSDIDLAVDGLKAKDFFPALAKITKESDFKIDLVDYKKCGKLLKERICRGKVLYEK